MARDPILDRLEQQHLTVLIEVDGQLGFATDREGLRPLFDVTVEHPELVDGADAALPAVGLGAAYLLIVAKVGRVFTGLLTHEARAALDEEGIEHEAEKTVKKLPEPYQTRFSALDERARQAVTAQAFAEDLRRLGD